MPFPASADRIVVQGYLLDEDTFAGLAAAVTSTPRALTGQSEQPLVLNQVSHTHIQTRPRSATPDPGSGYWAMYLLASDDPDVEAYGGRRITLPGQTPHDVVIPHDAPLVTVTSAMAAQVNAAYPSEPPLVANGSNQVRAVWFDQLATFAAPTPTSAYYDKTAVDSKLADLVAALSGGGGGAFDPEAVRDLVAVFLLAGYGLTKTVDDSGDTVTLAVSGLSKGDVGLNNVNNTADANKPVSAAVQAALDVKANLAALAAVALTGAYGDLSGRPAIPATYGDLSGTVPASALPALAINDTFVVADQAAMLALTAQRGDIAIRQDRITAQQPAVYILGAEGASTLANWILLPVPADAVASVAGRTGAVTLTKGDVGLGSVDNTADVDKPVSTATQTVLDAKTAKLTQRSTAATAATTAAANEIVPLDTTGGTFALTGPTSGAPFGARWKAGITAPTITAPAGYTIAGAASISMGLAPGGSSGELVVWQAFGTDYQPVDGFKPQQALAQVFKSAGDPARNPARATPAQPPKTIVSTFQAGHGWTATGAAGTTDLNDTVDVGLGQQSAKLVTDTAGTVAVLDSPTFSPGIDASGKDIKLLVKVEGLASLTDLRFYAGDATFANGRNWNLGPVESGTDVNYIKNGEWCWVTYLWDHSSAFGSGTLDRSAIARFRLRAQAANGQAMTVHVAAVALTPQTTVFPRGVVSMTYDDGRASGLTYGRRKLDQYGWAGTAFPIRDKIATSSGGTYVTLAELQALRDRSGWEIGCHADLGADHDAGFNTLTAAQVEADLLAQRRWLYDNKLGPGEGFAWPQGKSTKVHEDAAARVVAYGRNNSTVSRETFPPPMPMRVRSFNVGPATTLTQLQGFVDRAITSRSWLCLTWHDIVASPTTTLESAISVHDGIVDYIASLGAAGPAVLPMIDVIRANGLAPFAAASAPTPDVQTFSTSGTWTKPPGATRVEVICWGPGGPGGSGPRRASGTATCGGGGGAGGAVSRQVFRAADLAATETVTIGSQGTPGPAVTSDDTNGTAGTGATATTFGTTVRLRANQGNPGGAGGTSAPAAATAGVGTLLSGFPGGTPAVGAVGGSAFTAGGPAGAGAGGGLSTTPAAFAGGAGGSGSGGLNGGGAAGATSGGAGSAGTSGALTQSPTSGGGGGGGGSHTSGAAGSGGAGGAYGSGGGGGGAAINGNPSGAGALGGPGYCIVIAD